MDRKHQEEAALANWGGRPDMSDHGDEQKPQLYRTASDNDLIAVPRGLLGAAGYCVRKHVGTDSETYKALSALAMSPAPTAEDHAPFLNMLRSLHNIDGYQLPELNWGQQLDFVQNPVKYFVQAEDEHQAAIWREIAKRQVQA